jgi:hypothetical protein
MSAALGTRLAPVPATAAGPVTQVRVVRAEWTKLRALRSTRWCALAAAVLIVGLGAAIAGSGTPYRVSAANSAAGGVTIGLVGILFAQLVLVATALESSRGGSAISLTDPGVLRETR